MIEDEKEEKKLLFSSTTFSFFTPRETGQLFQLKLRISVAINKKKMETGFRLLFKRLTTDSQ